MERTKIYFLHLPLPALPLSRETDPLLEYYSSPLTPGGDGASSCRLVVMVAAPPPRLLPLPLYPSPRLLLLPRHDADGKPRRGGVPGGGGWRGGGGSTRGRLHRGDLAEGDLEQPPPSRGGAASSSPPTPPRRGLLPVDRTADPDPAGAAAVSSVINRRGGGWIRLSRRRGRRGRREQTAARTKRVRDSGLLCDSSLCSCVIPLLFVFLGDSSCVLG
uniref:Uncharacterized protein n=1 Tax=Oryza nivara TaxID=4536 RepID=A0A0E0H4P1_ORYNI